MCLQLCKDWLSELATLRIGNFPSEWPCTKKVDVQSLNTKSRSLPRSPMKIYKDTEDILRPTGVKKGKKLCVEVLASVTTQ